MKRPRVSVVMSVFNMEGSLKAAIDSILGQTLSDFELILINDGSSDGTAKIIASYNDQRIRRFEQTNHGLLYTLNRGIELARAPYIARMDGDDLSLPDRLSEQAKYLDEHPDVVMVGTCFEVFDRDGKVSYLESIPGVDADIRRAMYLRNQFGHGTMMLRRDAVLKAGGYDPKFLHIEDYDLWTRLNRLGEMAILPQVRYRWRDNEAGISHQHAATQHTGINIILDRLWQTPPLPAKRAELYRRAEEYRHLPELGHKLQKRYLQNELSLGWQLVRRGKRRPGLSQILSVITIGGSSTGVTFKFIRRGIWRFGVHQKNRLLLRFQR